MYPLLAFCFHLLTVSHPFYVSVTEINHNPEAASLEISIKMFSEDLEEALKTRFDQTTHLGLDNEHPDTDAYISLYLQDELQIQVNGKAIELTYLGKEASIETTWCYLEAKEVTTPTTFYVRSTIFTDLFETQKNMVHIRVNGKIRSMLLQRRQLSDQVEF